MSLEQTPSYHHPDHLRAYDTESPRQPWGQINMLMEMLDDILYAEGTRIQPNTALARERLFMSHFSYQYPRSEVSISGLSQAPEFLTLNVDHTRYLGRSALKQTYKVWVESSVRHSDPDKGLNRMITIFDLEEVAGEGNKYFGSVNRPYIVPRELGHPLPIDEQVTVYDCENLSHTLGEVLGLIKEDKEYLMTR